MANLSYGSRGDDVKQLQQALVDAGYSVGNAGVDGVYGNDTRSAVEKYQKDNGLMVDGIAGEQTFGSLYGNKVGTRPDNTAGQTAATPQTTPTGAATPTPAPAPSAPAKQEFKPSPAPEFTKSLDLNQYQYDPGTDAAYQQAMQALQQAQQTKPTYQGTYDAQLNDLYNQIVNRDKFSYDVNSDALYQQYKDQYITMGQMAMQDTIGQMSALTGGYGNSYAQGAGQQAYQGYLQQLTDKVPELYRTALDQYNQEGQNLMNQYAMLGDLADTEYSRYMDSMNEYWRNMQYLKGEADDAYNRGYTASRDQASDAAAQYQADYQKYRDDAEYQQWLDTMLYKQYQDDQEQSNWQAAFEYQQQRDQKSDEQWQAEFDETVRQFDQNYGLKSSTSGGSSGGSGGSSSGGSGGGSGSYDNQGYKSEDIKKLQDALGITADGKAGSQTMNAVKKAGYSSLADAMNGLGISSGSSGGGGGTHNEAAVKNFQSKIHPESQHDAIARDRYGSYQQYLAYEIEHSGLSDADKAYLISYYGIQEKDTYYKNKPTSSSGSSSSSYTNKSGKF